MARQLIEVVESRATMGFSIAILAVLFGGPVFEFFTLDRTPPVTSFTKAAALNSPIRAGEPLVARIWRDKDREDCTVASDRHATNQDGVVFDIENGQWRGGSPDRSYLDFAYPTSRFMPPGGYELSAHLVYTCPGGLTFEYDQPTIRFRVIE